MVWKLFRYLLFALAVVTAGGEARAKNWNQTQEHTVVTTFSPTIKFVESVDAVHKYSCKAQGLAIGYKVTPDALEILVSGRTIQIGRNNYSTHVDGVLKGASKEDARLELLKSFLFSKNAQVRFGKTRQGQAPLSAGFSYSFTPMKLSRYRGMTVVDFDLVAKGIKGKGKAHLANGFIVSLNLGPLNFECTLEGDETLAEEMASLVADQGKYGNGSTPRKLSASEVDGDFDKAMTALKNQDYRTALSIFQTLADLGIPRAQYNLGVMYDLGQGVSKNYREAMRLYKLAAETGFSPAQYNLAVMYENGEGSTKNYKEAIRLYTLAAEQGDNLAQYNLGVMYEKGLGVSRDFTEALRLYKLAASQGTAQAKARLAELGIGTSEASESLKLKAESEERKRKDLERQLAALKNQQEQRQQTISSDTQKPIIQITNASSNGPQGTVRGRVTDNTGIAEVRVDGQLVQVDDSGNFTQNTFVPVGGVAITVQATDLAGLSSSMSVRLERTATASSATLSFARLNPLVRKVAKNKDALALIIGVDSYENTPARAIYADKDAQVFADYATEKLGIPANRIKTLVNNGAGERELLLSVRSWLSRASKQGKTDVYVFFAGHGLASDDGSKMYLLPYDGAPELLDKTAILRDELFADIASANPRSVTMFLDTCYSGTTRGTDMLIASRPIAIKAIQKSIPKGFTVMTAAAGDQTAKPLEEAKHGMFSYFLMKGMEGDADANNDNQITAGELHQYVQQNVVQQSSGSQTPELQGDADRVLVRFE